MNIRCKSSSPFFVVIINTSHWENHNYLDSNIVGLQRSTKVVKDERVCVLEYEVSDRETSLGALPEEDVKRATKEALKQEKCIPCHIWFENVAVHKCVCVGRWCVFIFTYWPSYNKNKNIKITTSTKNLLYLYFRSAIECVVYKNLK